MLVSVAREDLAQDLRAYGEDDLAVRALELSDLEMGRVGVIAGRLLLDDEDATLSGASMLLAKACAMAAVEVMEGERRPLKRERRRSMPKLPRRRLPKPPLGEEKPRDVFLTACAEIARRFEPHGFSYAKSGPHISCRRGDATFEVSFASSHYNVAGAHVGHTLYAAVRSKSLRKWRLEQGSSREDASDRVAGGMLQNLKPGMPVATWDVADPDSRRDVLDDVEHAIRAAALPYFALFEGEDALIQRLKHETLPCFYALDAIEWLLSRGERDATIEHARVLLRDDCLSRQYERARKQMERGEMEIIRWSSIMEAEGLAYASLSYHLSF